MDLKRKIAIFGIIIMALIILWLLFFFDRSSDVIQESETVEQDSGPSQDVIEQINQLPPPDDAVVKNEQDYSLGLKQLAFSFAERFGSYSSHSGFKSLRDLEPLVTSKMQERLDEIIADNTADTNNYEAVDTRALSSSLLEFNQAGGRATVLVKTQKTSHFEDNNPVVSYEDLSLKFVLSAGEWLVDEASWQ